ncbi:MAG: alpha-L-arabinofuranosidase [Acidobacteriia bacterium]|nr:alpha-L-arabinofuranosidase [Terriglobia bacterium]
MPTTKHPHGNTRRDFLRTAALASALIPAGLRAEGADAHIDVLLDEPGAVIAPEIYSHFVENLGGVIYDGIWVGEGSRVPNVNGLRKELIDALRKVKPGTIRWPGGCFADQYDWRDGVGPRKDRPTRTNFWLEALEWAPGAKRNGPQGYDPNEVGTIEFARFCKLAGGQPYIAANLRSLPAQEMWRWVEYCNAPAGATTLARQRASGGEPGPLGVRFWGVGNESWGCGGNFAPEDYAIEFRRYATWIPDYGVHLALIGSGPNDNNVDWTRRFFAKMGPGGPANMWGWAMHHYAWNASGGRTANWVEGKRDAVKFDHEQYYEILRDADAMESMIGAHWAVMGETDRRHRVKLVVDEWGAWYAPGTEPFPEALLGQQNTMRDAVLAGLTLDTFNRHAEKVAMANVAQLVNCLQSLFLAHEDKFCLTPTYHVFDLYAAHQGARSVRMVTGAADVRYTRNGAAAQMRGLNGSASMIGKQLTLTVTNPSLDRAQDTEIALRGGAARSVTAVSLAPADAHAHNTFADPRAVEPKQSSVPAKGSTIAYRFPPASVTKLAIELG